MPKPPHIPDAATSAGNNPLDVLAALDESAIRAKLIELDEQQRALRKLLRLAKSRRPERRQGGRSAG